MSGVPPAHFVTFANRRYGGSLRRIRDQAKALDRFTTIRPLDERSLGNDYWQRHATTVRTHARGYGLWTWKPYVIAATLAEAAPGEMVVYCDAGCSLNVEGQHRFDEYLTLAAAHPTGMLGFELDGTVGEWTKRAALAALGQDTAATRRLQMISATCLVFQASAATRSLVHDWWEYMADPTVIDDTTSPGGEHPGFRGHRHDQSLFAVLAHQRNVSTIPDETWWPDCWHRMRQYPFHARRWRHRLPWSGWWMEHVPWPRW